MKLFRYGKPDAEKPGIVTNGIKYDVSHLVNDFDEDFFTNGGLKKLQSKFDPEKAATVPDSVRFGAPVFKPGKIVCIGLNYSKHAAES
ncbi:MAG: ureidoglycolate lyase, partial [Candidatus Paceibacterota bacterium]